MKRMIYTKLDETTKANDRKMDKMHEAMEKLNEDSKLVKGEIAKVST